MSRVVLPPSAFQDDSIVIRERQTIHHLVHVLRLRRGASLECFDGQGGIYEGTIVELARDHIDVRTTRKRIEPAQRVRCVLAIAVIRLERFEWIVEKATELGVAALIPMMTEHSLKRAGGAHRVERWRRIARSAAEQCGQPMLPQINEPVSFARALDQIHRLPMILPTLAGERTPLIDALQRLKPATDVAVLIGPEGDFSPVEVQAATAHGATLVSLGREVLRSETAAIATIAIVQAVLGAW